jgi:hypothetical protein
MIAAYVLIVMGEQPRRRTFPDPAIGQAEHQHIVNRQHVRRVDRLSGVNLLGGDLHRARSGTIGGFGGDNRPACVEEAYLMFIRRC